MHDTHPSARDILAELIRIPSVNPMGRAVSGSPYGEWRLTEYLTSFFEKLGVPYIKQEVAPDRYNVLACFIPRRVTRTVLLDAHQDTVPVEGMTISPFEPRTVDHRMYGRGACDVKGGMAAMLHAFVRLVQEKPQRAARVFLSCTCDEEFTATGIQHLMNAWEQMSKAVCGEAVRPDEAVIAEPTALQIVVAHRGVVRWRAVTHGRACHSSQPEQGENAVYRMAYMLEALQAYARTLQDTGPVDPLCGGPSLSVGRVEGGTSVNMVPDRCVAEIDRRLVPGEKPNDVVRNIQEFLESFFRQRSFPLAMTNTDWQFEPPWIVSLPLCADANQSVARRLAQSVEAVLGAQPPQIGVRYGTHACRTAASGIPSVVFGPGHIAQAHTADEWIDLNQLDQAAEIYYRYTLSDA